MATQDIGVGRIIKGEAHRDAIHIAVAPAIATCKLFPGQHVDANGATAGKKVGIVDPYLHLPVMPGEQFYIFLYPGSITTLRHHWDHPEFA